MSNIFDALGSDSNNQAILLEQTQFLREMLEGKNNWFKEQFDLEKKRNAALELENLELRNRETLLKMGLLEALTIAGATPTVPDELMDGDDFARLWALLGGWEMTKS